MRVPFLCLAVSLAAAALTSPALAANHLMVEGVLRDNAGNPLDGAFNLTFSLYTAATGGSPVWTEAHGSESVSSGLFQARLGETTPLSATIFAGTEGLWLGVTLAGQPELPRTPLETDPFAFRALTAASAGGLSCTGCIDAAHVSFSYAAAATPGGDAAVALLAKDLTCTGCIEATFLAAGAVTASAVTFVDTVAKLGATNVQGAIEKLKALLDAGGGGGGHVNEGAGVVREYTNQWGLPSYGVATEYVHLLNPTKPKVTLYLYGGQATSFTASNNLAVITNYAPNRYSGGAVGTAGESVLQVQVPATFGVGDHILIHQTVGSGGNGSGAGKWETNAVKGVTGSALILAKPLINSYASDMSGNHGVPRAQVVKAASFNLFEVGSNGNVYPERAFDGNMGGIVYIRAQSITVRNGGTIHADNYGFQGAGSCCYGPQNVGAQGWSECNSTTSYGHSDANCSGGGGGDSGCCCTSNGSGGGGNKTAGQNGNGGSQSGKGGAAKGDLNGNTLHFGGAGGGSRNGSGGAGGGLVVLGGATVILESGAKVRANGQTQNGGQSCYSGRGGGAGGTVALYAGTLSNNGTVEAKAGTGEKNGPHGGDGGEGWVILKQPVTGVVNQTYATGVEIWVDGVNVTPSVGDPNAKGTPHWDATNKRWGATGTEAWTTGPLDLSNVANWTLGEHRLEYKEIGGAGGDLKSYLYVIHPFTASKPPANDTCTTPVTLDLSAGPVVTSGSTEDVMGKVRAIDDSSVAGCGGVGGPDVVYKVDLGARSLLSAVATAPFSPKLYVLGGDCSTGNLVYCADQQFTTNPLDAGTYYLWLDSDAAQAKGDFSLAVSATPAPLPPNDTCANPFELVFGPTGKAVHSGTTLYALDNLKGLCPAAKSGGPDVVYQFTAGTGATLTATLKDHAFKPILYLYTSKCGSQGVPLSCSGTGTLSVSGLAGGTYWLVVDGEAEKEWGPYTLDVTVQ